MFKKILVPLDGSEHSVRALKKAVQLAKKFDGKITLIHVYSTVYPVSVSPINIAEAEALTPELVSELIEASHARGDRILEDGEKKAKAEGVQVKKLLKEGHTVEEILRTAEEGKFDLIVVGARGLSRIREIFMGSVSHGVIIHARCPVLVVK